MSLCLFRNMELKSYRPYQPYLIFLNMVMEGVHSQLYLLARFSGRILKLLGYFISKVQVKNPAALASNPGKRVAACWEPTVIATIIIPSE